MNQPHSSSTAPDLDLKREPVRDGSSSDSSSSLNVRTFAIITVVLTMMLGLGEAWRRKMVEASERKEAVEHCQLIVISLRLSSTDSTGDYPYKIYNPDTRQYEDEAKNANEVFRRLFPMGSGPSAKDEMIFSCARSPFRPDGRVGTAPLWEKALQKGENHWAVTWGLSQSTSSAYPLVFENPADIRMPPRWDADAAGKPVPGRCWPDRRVVIGFNDGTVQWMKLEAGSGLRKLEMQEETDDSGHRKKYEVFPPNLQSGEPTRLLQVDQ